MTFAQQMLCVFAVALGSAPAGARSAEVCPDMVKYVCATKSGQPKTYVNSCFARADGASHIGLGKCEGEDVSQMKFCPENIIPVCASKEGKPATYGNACIAIADGVKILHKWNC
jgi:hypothetical protein